MHVGQQEQKSNVRFFASESPLNLCAQLTDVSRTQRFRGFMLISCTNLKSKCLRSTIKALMELMQPIACNDHRHIVKPAEP